MDRETESVLALSKFKSSLKNKKPFGNDGVSFEGLVTYSAKGKMETEILEVFLIMGRYEIMIKLDIFTKGKIITSKDYHLDHNPKYVNGTYFIFNEVNNTITIEGTNSPKLGNYKIVIIEK